MELLCVKSIEYVGDQVFGHLPVVHKPDSMAAKRSIVLPEQLFAAASGIMPKSLPDKKLPVWMDPVWMDPVWMDPVWMDPVWGLG
ncbi:hypothetical protein GCM10023187_18160 [Nibrella viscosa]|uniref:Uncharacterized protein n=1 Tax=Nibrella viscosa TaxID=1084524 RepID=A0ABP8K9U5_9BACT